MELRYYFVLYFMAVRKFDPVDRMYKEVSDRTLLGPIEAKAVYWSGVITKIW